MARYDITRITCDRCKATWNVNESEALVPEVQLTEHGKQEQGANPPCHSWDLCDSCTVEFKAWANYSIGGA